MIIISPYSKPLKNGNNNAKNYPYWEELVRLINGHGDPNKVKQGILQLGAGSEEKINGTSVFVKDVQFKEVMLYLSKASIVICVDNFMQHMFHYYLEKCTGRCVVLWGQSDPRLFGYKENINLIRGPQYFRQNQFDTWDGVPLIKEAFLPAESVYQFIKHLL